MDTQETRSLSAPEGRSSEGPKRRQIIDGACRVFLERGFDAASMGEIAREAGVSKGTLYVYFKSKDELFEAITEEQCTMQAERVFELDNADRDVAGALTKLGATFAHFMCNRSTSPIRTVIAIADRMPEIGRQFYETGPAVGIAKLARYLEAQVAAGVLEVEDCNVAAGQFLDSCLSVTFKPVLFNFSAPPPDERIAYVVGIAVRTFMKAYGKT